MDWVERVVTIGFAILAAGMASLVVALVMDIRSQGRCESVGGRVERYNFHTILLPVVCGSGCTIMMPTEVSDWRCIGVMAEAR
jgi:hypothetical protein